MLVKRGPATLKTAAKEPTLVAALERYFNPKLNNCVVQVPIIGNVELSAQARNTKLLSQRFQEFQSFHYSSNSYRSHFASVLSKEPLKKFEPRISLDDIQAEPYWHSRLEGILDSARAKYFSFGRSMDSSIKSFNSSLREFDAFRNLLTEFFIGWVMYQAHLVYQLTDEKKIRSDLYELIKLFPKKPGKPTEKP